MARVQDILNRVNDTLSDHSETRWEVSRLLRALSEGQEIIARKSKCLRFKATIELCDGHHTYKIPEAVPGITNATALALFNVRNHASKRCNFVTEAWMDAQDEDWREETDNDITHIIYDSLKPLHFRVYPIPESDDITETGASFNTTNNPLTEASTITAAISTESNFDLTAELAPVKMLVEYFYLPPPITTIADTNLLISDLYDHSLKYYITGVVLRDDLDAANREFAKEELSLFDALYEEADTIVQKGFVDQRKQYYASVGYNAVIE